MQMTHEAEEASARRIAEGRRISERVPIEAGGTLYVDLDRGHVDVATHVANEVRVEAEASGWGDDQVSFLLEADDDAVWLDCYMNGLSRFLRLARVRVRIWVPEEFSGDIRTRGGRLRLRGLHGDVFAHTSGGHIEAEKLDGMIDLETSGGNIRLDDIYGDVRAKTSGGHLEFSDIDGDVKARTSGGNIGIEDLSGTIDARTSGGHINVTFADQEPAGDLRTSGGHVEVALRESASLRVDARSSGGGVRVADEFEVFGDVSRNRVNGDIADGGHRLTLRTSGGSIEVKSYDQ